MSPSDDDTPLPSTQPYLLRALHEWCTDNGLTPFIAVKVDGSVRVPPEFVRNGEIVLNISYDATSKLQLGNEYIEFQARFGGVLRHILVPVNRVMAIYARENGQGMAFAVPDTVLASSGLEQGHADDAPAAQPPHEAAPRLMLRRARCCAPCRRLHSLLRPAASMGQTMKSHPRPVPQDRPASVRRCGASNDAPGSPHGAASAPQQTWGAAVCRMRSRQCAGLGAAAGRSCIQ